MTARLVSAALWGLVGAAKMAALALLIGGDWRPALLALAAAWSLAGAALWLRGLRRV